MSYEIKGKVCHIGQVLQVSSTFKKADLAIEISEESGDKIYTNFIKFQVVQDKCSLLNQINIGDTIEILFNIKGNRVEKNGATNYFSNLDIWKINVVSKSGNVSQKVTDLEDIDEMPF